MIEDWELRKDNALRIAKKMSVDRPQEAIEWLSERLGRQRFGNASRS